jgi:hypothetical protein
MRTVFALLLMTTAAYAQDVPTDEMKKAALMRAYEANGNSMVGWGAYDATVRVIKTEKITGGPLQNYITVAPEKKVAQLVVVAPPSNICTRHGLRKVTRGRSWHCR